MLPYKTDDNTLIRRFLNTMLFLYIFLVFAIFYTCVDWGFGSSLGGGRTVYQPELGYYSGIVIEGSNIDWSSPYYSSPSYTPSVTTSYTPSIGIVPAPIVIEPTPIIETEPIKPVVQQKIVIPVKPIIKPIKKYKKPHKVISPVVAPVVKNDCCCNQVIVVYKDSVVIVK